MDDRDGWRERERESGIFAQSLQLDDDDDDDDAHPHEAMFSLTCALMCNNIRVSEKIIIALMCSLSQLSLYKKNKKKQNKKTPKKTKKKKQQRKENITVSQKSLWVYLLAAQSQIHKEEESFLYIYKKERKKIDINLENMPFILWCKFDHFKIEHCVDLFT